MMEKERDLEKSDSEHKRNVCLQKQQSDEKKEIATKQRMNVKSNICI